MKGRRVTFKDPENDNNSTLLTRLTIRDGHGMVYPTSQTRKYKDKIRSAKDKGENIVVPKKKQVEQHFDDCGSDFPDTC